MGPARFLTGHIRAGPKRAGLAHLPPLKTTITTATCQDCKLPRDTTVN